MNIFDFDSYLPQDTPMQQILERARSESARRVNILITGAKGTGKTSLAYWLQKFHGGPQSLTRIEFRDLASLKIKESSQTVSYLIENIDSWSVIEQKILFDWIENRKSQEACRWIVTSKKDLRALARRELFVPELYYRLCVMQLALPSLSERTADLPMMAQFILEVNGFLLNKPALKLSAEALAVLSNHSWADNIYELENVLSRAAALAQGPELRASDIELHQSSSHELEGHHVGMTLDEVERKLILQTLELTAQNRTRAAEILGISVRTLRNKINEYKEGSHHESL